MAKKKEYPNPYTREELIKVRAENWDRDVLRRAKLIHWGAAVDELTQLGKQAKRTEQYATFERRMREWLKFMDDFESWYKKEWFGEEFSYLADELDGDDNNN